MKHHGTEKSCMLPLARRIFLAAITVAFLAAPSSADDWPQWRGPKRDGVWRETGIVEKFKSSQLTPKWRVDVGSGYCGPTIASGRVYLMDRVVRPNESERVVCLDEETGKQVWAYQYACPYARIGYHYPAGPRASVTVDGGKAYALGATGR